LDCNRLFNLPSTEGVFSRCPPFGTIARAALAALRDAHVQCQQDIGRHALAHWHMLRAALALRDGPEVPASCCGCCWCRWAT
jgi:hypothetical protein